MMTLVPCPFCKATQEDRVADDLGDTQPAVEINWFPSGSDDCFKVHCSSCGASGPAADTFPGAGEKWNLRP